MKRRVLRFATSHRRSFELIRAGKKTVETRAGSSRYQNIESGDILVFSCGQDRFEKVVKRVYRATTPEELLAQVPFRLITPELDSEEKTVQVWYSFPGYRERIQEFGMLGFEV